MPAIEVTFQGTRGSVPTPGEATRRFGGNTACTLVRCGETIVILDAGTGIRELGLQLAEEARTHGGLPPLAILLSHTHWDHIQGLPFFQPAYMPEIDLTIYGSAKKGFFLEHILGGQMTEQYFPIPMGSMAANVAIKEIEPGNAVQIGELAITVEDQAVHPGGSMRFALSDGTRRLVYATDVELNKLRDAAPGDPDAAARLQAYRRFIQSADLLIGDGQYLPDEYPAHVDWGHTSVDLLIELAREAAVKRLSVFHHDPNHSDDLLDRMEATYAPQGGEVAVTWAREASTITF